MAFSPKIIDDEFTDFEDEFQDVEDPISFNKSSYPQTESLFFENVFTDLSDLSDEFQDIESDQENIQ